MSSLNVCVHLCVCVCVCEQILRWKFIHVPLRPFLTELIREGYHSWLRYVPLVFYNPDYALWNSHNVQANIYVTLRSVRVYLDP